MTSSLRVNPASLEISASAQVARAEFLCLGHGEAARVN